MEDGEAAFQSDDYATAVRLWRPLADQGNSEAQTKLGLMYRISISALLQEYHLRRWHTHRHQCSLGI